MIKGKIMEDYNFKYRYATLVNNEEDKTVNNRRLNIRIENSIPILTGAYINRISGEDGKNYGLIETVETETEFTTRDTKNFLYDDRTDENGDLLYPDRYKYLGRAKSILTNLYVSIYYDNNYNDIITLPDLYSFGTEDDSGIDFYANNVMTIEAQSIGRGSFKDRPNKDITLSVDSEGNGIPVPDRFDKTTTLLASTFGMAKNSICNDKVISVDIDGDTTYVNVDRTAPLQYIEFPLNENIYETVPKMAVHNYIQQGSNLGASVDYVGMHVIDKIIIPINF